MANYSETSLNPTKGPMLPGVKINEKMSLCSLPANLLFQLTLDPRDAEDRKKVASSKDLQELAELREDVQRLFEGQKRKNVPHYADYICSLRKGVDGMTPPIILYSKDALKHEYDECGLGFLQVSWGKRLIAIDGETQLASRNEAKNVMPETSEENVAVMIVHGFSKNWARQSFHDLNVLGVKPNSALGIGMDSRDPLTRVARDVETHVPFLKGRVNKSRRQLRGTDTDVITITTLRGACITMVKGISGVKYGAKPVIVPDQELPQLTAVAREWFGLLADTFGPAMEDRERKLASAPSILSALGAVGHELIHIQDASKRSQKMLSLIENLRDVNWQRGKCWEGIAGKFTPKGAFSVGGSKETAYAVYEALADRESEAYRRIRLSVPGAAE